MQAIALNFFRIVTVRYVSFATIFKHLIGHKQRNWAITVLSVNEKIAIKPAYNQDLLKDRLAPPLPQSELGLPQKTRRNLFLET